MSILGLVMVIFGGVISFAPNTTADSTMGALLLGGGLVALCWPMFVSRR